MIYLHMPNNYKTTFIENKFPITEISKLAIKEGNSKRPIYQLHKWWARRLGSIVRGLIIGSTLSKHHTEEDFWKAYYSKNNIVNYTVMDIFMGGGSSLVEAKKMGAKTIGIDIDPIACFISEKELEAVDLAKLKKTYKTIKSNVASKIKRLYTTQVNKEDKPVINYFWVYHVTCPYCAKKFDAHPHYKVYNTKNEQGVICKKCGTFDIIDIKRKVYNCKNCKTKTLIEQGPFSRGKCRCPNCKNKFDLKENLHGANSLKLFALEYEDKGKRFYKESTLYDQCKYNEAVENFNQLKDTLFIPDTLISIENQKDRRPLTHGYYYYKDLFNNRQLLSLGLLLQEISKISDKVIRKWFILIFSDTLSSNNILCSYAYGYKKLTPLFGIHAYTVPARPVETNVWGTGSFGRGNFEKTFKKIIKAKMYCEQPYEITINSGKTNKLYTQEKINSIVTNKPSEFYTNTADSLILNQSSEDISQVQDASVDLILTDPPYYDNLHYSHLANFYYQWIKKHINSSNTEPLANALFAQNDSNESFISFKTRLIKIFQEAHKKLVPNGLMIFSYHHNKENAWMAIGEALKKSNFIISNIFPIRSEGQSAYHSGKQTIKWDSIIIARKKESFLPQEDQSLYKMIQDWNNKINNEDLQLNTNDKLSFFRSLAIQKYVNSSENLKMLFQQVNSTMEFLFDKK